MINEERYKSLESTMLRKGMKVEEIPSFRKTIEEMDMELTKLFLANGQFSKYVQMGKMSLIDDRFKTTDDLTGIGIFYFESLNDEF
jgi:hypothetical protein